MLPEPARGVARCDTLAAMKRSGPILAALLVLTCAACGGDPEEPQGSGGGTAGSGSAAGSGGGAGGDATSRGWKTLAPLPGGPRQETAVVALDGRVVVLGGFDETGDVVADVEIYDPATDTWSAGAPLPEPLHHINAAVVDGKVYVLGALSGLDFTVVGRSYVLDPAAGSWTQLASMPPGSERGAGAVGVIGARVYVAGGLGLTASVADVSIYDVEQDAWEAGPPMPAALDHLVGGAVDGVFHVIGGRSGGIQAISGAVYALDPAAFAWASRAPMITPRGGAAAAVVGGRFLVVGGEGNADAPSGVFPHNEAYDPATDTWESLPAMPSPRHGTGAAGVGNTLYVPGGADKQAFGAVDTHEGFTVE